MIRGILNSARCGMALCFFIIFVFLNGFAPILGDNDREAGEWVEKTLAGLTLEQKVAQLICMDISGNYFPEDDPRIASWVTLASDYGIGGFVLYGGTPLNVAYLLNRLQKEAEIPLLISADFESGPGQQIAGASEFPANMAFAAIRDEDLMYRAAKIMAKEGKALGIHLTYTPVTDVSVSPDNPQESVRSFGGDIDLVGKMLHAYVKGYKEAGMLTTAKHFPGRGDMKAIVGYPGFSFLDKPAEEFFQKEFRAFRYAVEAGVDFIMTEHIAVPSVTGGSYLPASVEPQLIKGVIRENLGFRGIITTDDLWYDHVCDRFGEEEVAMKALEAGHDILLKPKNPVAVIQAVVDAVAQGRISERQINHSVYKLLVQKARLGLHKNRFVETGNIGATVGTAKHLKVVEEIADRSVTLLRNEDVFPLKTWDANNTVHITIQKDEDQPNVSILCREMELAFNGISNYCLKPELGESYYEQVRTATEQAEWVILSFFVQRDRYGDPAPLQVKDMELIRHIIDSKPGKVIAMSYGNPHIVKKIETVPVFFTGYSEGGWYGNQQIYFNSFIKLMRNELKPSGKLPLVLNDYYSIGFGLTY